MLFLVGVDRHGPRCRPGCGVMRLRCLLLLVRLALTVTYVLCIAGRTQGPGSSQGHVPPTPSQPENAQQRGGCDQGVVQAAGGEGHDRFAHTHRAAGTQQMWHGTHHDDAGLGA
eukprot:1639317-Rhodomonas_salina.2